MSFDAARNVFYATREIGRLYETGRYLHNYGLAYALGLAVAPYYNATAVPRYAEDLNPLNDREVYVTPARPLDPAFTLHTFKYADNRYRVKMEQSSRNTPTFGRAKELAVESKFEFMILSSAPCQVPRWVRLGKWMSKTAVEVISEEVQDKIVTGEFTSAMPLNPLDLPESLRLLAYDLISMPPVSLLDHAMLSGPHFKLQGGERIPTGLAFRFPPPK
ncbi:MAG: type I-D CRISPR-associated protein Cas5/Csc1 [Anaerolineales bacterium]|nr:type I-D CRISPR-associated protein Cas5/Csc1 [Anaerolineales bacterium]